MTRIAAARAPEPETSPNPRIFHGANRPPIEEMGRIDFKEAVDALQTDNGTPLRKKIAEWIDSSTRAVAVDDETAGRCAQLAASMAKAEGRIEAKRVEVKAPYLEAGRAIDAAAKAEVADLVEARTKVRKIHDDYVREKQRKIDEERRRAEYAQSIMRHIRECGMGMIGGKTHPFPILIRELEEKVVIDHTLGEFEKPARDLLESTLQHLRDAFERHKAEPEAPAVLPPAPEPTYIPPAPKVENVQIRSDFGASSSTRRIKVAVITDWKKAFNKVKDVPAVQEAVQKAINAVVRANPAAAIPGVEIRDDVAVTVRA